MSRLEVLLSTMHQQNYKLVETMNIDTDVLIINQGSYNKYEEYEEGRKKIRVISTDQRGLSRSRNQALLFAKGEICLIADDDIVYKQKYSENILRAFDSLPDADIIVFNTSVINSVSGIKRKEIKKIRCAPKHRNYGSVRIAFKRESFLKNNLWFNVFFGAGSMFGAGEESLILREANKKGLKIYEHPVNIADVDYSTSSWFEGYNEKYFYNKGAYLAAAYPILNILFKYYFVIKFYKHTNLDALTIIKYINKGIMGYKNLIPFEKL